MRPSHMSKASVPLQMKTTAARSGRRSSITLLAGSWPMRRASLGVLHFCVLHFCVLRFGVPHFCESPGKVFRSRFVYDALRRRPLVSAQIARLEITAM